jgi:hypothetical protein
MVNHAGECEVMLHDYSIMQKICGTCKHWQTERGYECEHAGYFGGDLYDKKRHPYCIWESATQKEISKREKLRRIRDGGFCSPGDKIQK